VSAPAERGLTVNFDRINAAALADVEGVITALLPQGRRKGGDWEALSPRFRQTPRVILANLKTGRWAELFGSNGGGDLIGLAAFVRNVSRRNAAIALAEHLGVDPFGEGQ
jgi:hypothetical protein